MPMYNYHCSVCQETFESLQKMDIETVACLATEGCTGVAERCVSPITHYNKLGPDANYSSVRFNFNYPEN